jgi:DNA (cytosine-5)-methyltransferase 1
MINVDCSQTTHIGLCAGYGGIELGLRRAIPTLRSVALCEIEAFACANLVAKMEAGLVDPAPIWTDLKSFPWESFRDRVDLLTGGYPCQPFSSAGKRAGSDDPRHLWPFIASGISILRPRICFFENVEGHISLGLAAVISDLEELGYRTTWGIFSASEVGAPHRRKRVFILAYGYGQRGQLQNWWHKPAEQLPICHGEKGGDECPSRPSELADDSGERLSLSYGQRNGSAGQRNAEPQCCGCNAWPSRPGEQQFAWEPPRVVGNANSPRPQERQGQRGAGIQGIDSDGGEDADRQAQPAMGRDTDGSTDWMGHAELFVSCDNRTDELRLLGNGVVPATAERAFRVLMEQFA